MEYLNEIITGLSILAAILAWIAKLRWSKEFAMAKDEIIKAKEAQIAMLKQQIENLKELNPSKLKEYFDIVKEQLNKYNELLKKQLEEAKNEIKQKEKDLETLRTEEDNNKDKIEILSEEKENLEKNVNQLESNIQGFPVYIDENNFKNAIINRFDKESFDKISKMSNKLDINLENYKTGTELKKLSEEIKANFDHINNLNTELPGI
ncbi:MAG: hypothetical protein JXR51_01190 [Bacteroidales bacterium]|nr:hypothetical protein [Bacteroidales bacterium]MBN2755758.1 hypothetical protein [Bacteroidales bacterium]